MPEQGTPKKPLGLPNVQSGVWSVPLARGLVPTLLRLPEAPNGCYHEEEEGEEVLAPLKGDAGTGNTE